MSEIIEVHGQQFEMLSAEEWRTRDIPFKGFSTQVKHGARWGQWVFDANTLVLRYDDAYGYEVDLEEFKKSTRMLDMIFQVANKAWASIEDIGCLIVALEVIFTPQSSLIGREIENPAAFLRKKIMQEKRV